MIKAITFDVGSTLLFPHPSVAETFVTAASRYGNDITLETAESHVDDCWKLYFAEYQRDGDFWCTHEGCKHIWEIQYALLCDLCGLTSHKAEIVNDVYEAFLRGHHWEMYADVVPTLEVLRERGIRMAVISNWDTDLLNILDDLELSPYFEVILPSALVGLRKPNPAFFEEALGRLDLTPAEVLHVGDMDDADGDGPVAAGMRAVIIDRHRQGGHRYRAIASLTELVEMC